MSIRHYAWTHIEQLTHVRAWLQYTLEAGARDGLPALPYRAKIKLHGTNAGVIVAPDGTVAAQSRNRVLAETDDHYGFARWVAEARDAFASLARPDGTVVIYGEWAGPGVQRKVAVAGIDRKVFAVFAVGLFPDEGEPHLMVEPEALATVVPVHPDVYVLPWHGAVHTLDFGDRLGLGLTADRIAKDVLAVERCDPWVAEHFGVQGIGEGLVLYPVVGDGFVPRESVTRLLWKAKGQEHQVRKADKVVQVDPEVLAGIDAFVDAFATEARLRQGLAEVLEGRTPTRKDIGPFLKWFGGDVRREGRAELEASGLTWKQVAKAVNRRAVSWLHEQMDSL